MNKPSFFTRVAAALTNVAGFTTGAVVTTSTSLRPSYRRLRSTHTYGQRGYNGRDLRLDIYRPAVDHPVPVVFWVHGGGWEIGHRRFIPPGILAQTDRGYAIVSVSYSFLRRAKWPTQLHEVKTALRWLGDHSATLRLDTSSLVIAGESAGGHIAAAAALTHDDIDSLSGLYRPGRPSTIAGVVTYYAPTDLAQMTKGNPLQRFVLAYMTGFRDAEVDEIAQLVNPVRFVTSDAPPFHILHGTWDEVVPYDQAELLSTALQAAGVDVTLQLFPTFVHIDPRFNRPERMASVEAFIDRINDRHR